MDRIISSNNKKILIQVRTVAKLDGSNKPWPDNVKWVDKSSQVALIENCVENIKILFPITVNGENFYKEVIITRKELTDVVNAVGAIEDEQLEPQFIDLD